MRNNILIRGLGRRSFEPVQNDTNAPGSQPSQNSPPESQNRDCSDTNTPQPFTAEPISFDAPPSAHQLNTAQNEVLRKVSELLKGSGGKVLDHEELVWENEVGLIVSAVDMAVNYLIFWPLVAIRNRIQTFTALGGERLRDIYYNAIVVEGPRGLYSGMAAHLAFQIAGIAKELARDRVLRWLDDRGFFDSRRRRTWFRRVSTVIDMVFWVAILYPMYRYSLLQTNLLLPAMPLIPMPWTTTPSIPLLPSFTPPTSSWLNMGTAKFLIHQASHSALLWAAVNRSAVTKIRSETFRITMSLIPKPNNPDEASLKATREFEGDSEIDYPGLGSGDSLRRRSSRRPNTTQAPPVGIESESDDDDRAGEADTTNIILSDIDSGQQYTVSVPPPDIPFHQFADEGDYNSDDEWMNGIAEEAINAIQQEALQYTQTLFDASNPAAPPAPLARTSSLPAPNVEVIEPASTLTPPAVPPPARAPRRSRRPRTKGPHHRVTTLSQHPADSASSQAGDALSNFACLFLESAALRCLALEFLPASQHGEILHPFSITANGALVLKSLMVEWAVSWVVFQITLRATKEIGKRMFNYPSGPPEKKPEGVTLTDPGTSYW